MALFTHARFTLDTREEFEMGWTGWPQELDPADDIRFCGDELDRRCTARTELFDARARAWIDRPEAVVMQRNLCG